MGAASSQPDVPQPPPIIPPPAKGKAAAPPLPIEQRCIACLNYHHHDHPSILTEGANFQTMFYPVDSPREKYEGILIKGLPEWFVRLKFRSGATYEGGFRAGEFNGFGHYVVEGQYEYLGGYNDEPQCDDNQIPPLHLSHNILEMSSHSLPIFLNQ